MKLPYAEPMSEKDVKDIIGKLDQYVNPDHPDFDPELAYFLVFSVRPEWFTEEQKKLVKSKYELYKAFNGKQSF